MLSWDDKEYRLMTIIILPLRTPPKRITQQQLLIYLLRHHWIGLERKVLYAHDWQVIYLISLHVLRITLTKKSWIFQSLICFNFFSSWLFKTGCYFTDEKIVERINGHIWFPEFYWMLALHEFLVRHTLMKKLVVQYNNRYVTWSPFPIKQIYKSQSFWWYTWSFEMGRFPYMWAIVTSAVYHPYMYMYGKNIYLSAD